MFAHGRNQISCFCRGQVNILDFCVCVCLGTMLLPQSCVSTQLCQGVEEGHPVMSGRRRRVPERKAVSGLSNWAELMCYDSIHTEFVRFTFS